MSISPLLQLQILVLGWNPRFSVLIWQWNFRVKLKFSQMLSRFIFMDSRFFLAYFCSKSLFFDINVFCYSSFLFETAFYLLGSYSISTVLVPFGVLLFYFSSDCVSCSSCNCVFQNCPFLFYAFWDFSGGNFFVDWYNMPYT